MAVDAGPSHYFIQEARERMKRKGTIGAFGKATAKHIASAKKHGGLEKKRAIFAENMKKIARRRHGESASHERKESKREERTEHRTGREAMD